MPLNLIIRFVLDNRCNGAFKNYSLQDIIEEFSVSYMKDCYLVMTDLMGIIVGVATGEFNKSDTLHIRNILLTKRVSIKEFVSYAKKKYPTVKYFTGRRGDKLVTYPVNKV